MAVKICRKDQIESPSVRGCGLKSGWALGRQIRCGSPSVRGCGLKCSSPMPEDARARVTLRARVWVEIPEWLKSLCNHLVTLRARVWVEIGRALTTPVMPSVTLRARVWVEMRRAASVRMHRPVTLRARVWGEIAPRPPCSWQSSAPSMRRCKQKAKAQKRLKT